MANRTVSRRTKIADTDLNRNEPKALEMVPGLRIAGDSAEVRSFNIRAVAAEVRLIGKRVVILAIAFDRGDLTAVELLACARQERERYDQLAVEIAALCMVRV